MCLTIRCKLLNSTVAVYFYLEITNCNVMILSDISGREYSDLTVNAAPSCEDISHMIRLCPDYSLLGGRLLDTATSLANERAAGTALPGGIMITTYQLLLL